MKWGRKNKSSTSSSSSSSIITRVLPVSWFSKFKQKSENPETRIPNNHKYRNEFEDYFPTPNPKARFYSMDDSFSDERTNIPARRSTGGFINPIWYDEFRFPVMGFKNEAINFGIQKMKDGKWKRRGVRAKMSELEIASNSGERGVFPVEPEYMVRMKDGFSDLAVSNFSKQPEIPIKKVKPKQKVKVRAYSPRTECKIRAIEEMKKARLKMKEEKRRVEGKTVFNSFAVVKSSFDPRGDFRDSMVEMIREKGICRSEDLEELLACYLALNDDEYHDIIIKVFREVWFGLKGVQHFDY